MLALNQAALDTLDDWGIGFQRSFQKFLIDKDRICEHVL